MVPGDLHRVKQRGTEDWPCSRRESQFHIKGLPGTQAWRYGLHTQPGSESHTTPSQLCSLESLLFRERGPGLLPGWLGVAPMGLFCFFYLPSLSEPVFISHKCDVLAQAPPSGFLMAG